MTQTTITPLLLAAALLAGCATSGAHYAPMVDTGQRLGEYNADLAECQRYAERAVGASEGAVGGAVAGAVVVGLLSAVLGGGGHGRWAAAGAISGGLSGAAAGDANQRAVVMRCMSGRGYQVLQ